MEQAPAETPVNAIAEIVREAETAWPAWAGLSAAQRAAKLLPLSELFADQLEDLARATTASIHRPIRQSRAEIIRCRESVKYLCAETPKWLEPEETQGGRIYFDPLGVVALISPWNHPFAMPLLVALPSLIAGNTLIF